MYCRLPLFLKGDVGLPEGGLEDILTLDSPETDKTPVGQGTDSSAGQRKGGGSLGPAFSAVTRMFRRVCLCVNEKSRFLDAAV